jgi:WD40 repeat protein
MSPDGRRIVTGGADGMLAVFDNGGKRLEQVRLGSKISSVAFSRDGGEIITASADRRVRIWQTGALWAGAQTLFQTTQAQSRLVGLEQAVLSPSGQQVLTVSSAQAWLWSRRGATRPMILSDWRGPFISAGFCSDGQRIFALTQDGKLRLWHQQQNRFEVPISVLPQRDITALRWSADGKRVLLASADRTAQLLSADGSGGPLAIYENLGEISAVALAPDSSHIAIASEDGAVKLLKDDGRGPYALLRGHSGAVSHVVYSPDGRFLASAASDRQVRVWSLAEPERAARVIAEYKGQIESLAFSPDAGKLLVLAQTSSPGQKVIEVWDLRAQDKRQAADVLYQGGAHEAHFSPDGRQVVGVLRDGQLHVWPMDGRGGVQVISASEAQDSRSVAYTPDSRRLLAGSSHGLLLLDVAEGALSGRRVFRSAADLGWRKLEDKPILGLYSAAGGQLLLAVFDSIIHVVTPDGHPVASVDTSIIGQTQSFAVSPDGTTGVIVNKQGAAWLFSIPAQEPAEPLSMVIMRQLWRTSRRCTVTGQHPELGDAGERAYRERLNLCDSMQKCIFGSLARDPFPDCYKKLHPVDKQRY